VIGMSRTYSRNDRRAILCVGWNEESTRLLLAFRGYDVSEATPADAPGLLRRRRFHLVIVAHDVPDNSFRQVFAAAPDGTRLVQLEEFTLPEDLFLLIDRLLGPRKKAQVVAIDRK
jgi:hypothetical protein